MIYVGIDVASTKHDIAVTNHLGEVLVTNFSITNNFVGFRKLHNLLIDLESPNTSMYIGLESTGLYHINLANFLSKLDYNVSVINPLLTNMTRKSLSVRPTKTDTIDALVICRYLEGNKDQLKFYTPSVYITDTLKSLSRSRFKLQSEISNHKLELSNLVSRCFPEYFQFYTVFSCLSSYQFLSKYPTPSIISNTRIDALANSIRRATKGHSKRSFAQWIKDTAKVSIGDQSDTYEVMIPMKIEIINFLTSKVNILDLKIKSILDDHFDYFLTIPGFGPKTAGLLIGEIGDINRFKSVKHLVAYFGLDPIVYQSGNFKASNTKGSKRGSSYARYALFHAAKIASMFDKDISSYYQKKRSEGKHHYVALVHVSKKLLRISYSILHSKDTYK